MKTDINPMQQPYPRKEDAALVRLHRLVRKGYRAGLGDWAGWDETSVRLEHPRGTAAGAPLLQLCSDGAVIGIDNERPLNSGEGDPDCIYVESWEDFQAFVDGVPKPTLLQTIDHMAVWELRARLEMWLILVLFGTLVGLGVGTVLPLVTGLWEGK